MSSERPMWKDTVADRTARLTAERDAFRAMLADVLGSAHPNPRDHPAMTKQWARAQALLTNGPVVEPIRVLIGESKGAVQCPNCAECWRVTGDVSDGYHTFDELYAHRIALFLALCAWIHPTERTVWRSKLHSDGSSIDGWFIMGIGTKPGKQITYHLPMDRWPDADFLGTEAERAPDFDGHTPADVVARLRRWGT